MHPTINVMEEVFREQCFQCKDDCSSCKIKIVLDEIKKMKGEAVNGD